MTRTMKMNYGDLYEERRGPSPVRCGCQDDYDDWGKYCEGESRRNLKAVEPVFIEYTSNVGIEKNLGSQYMLGNSGDNFRAFSKLYNFRKPRRLLNKYHYGYLIAEANA